MSKPWKRTLVLIILDGWGLREASTNNAIALAKTPHWDALWQTYPHAGLDASGEAVGLPAGQMGNSEVGHLTMGAGRVIDQDLNRINKAIHSGEFFKNKVLKHALHTLQKNKKNLHILGLASPGGIHSHISHIQAMIQMAAEAGVENIFVHAFLDGRDTPPKSAASSIAELEKTCEQFPAARIASLCGRYYAMDRDKRFDRTQVAYDLITAGKAEFEALTPGLALKAAYERGETDEFVKPTVILPRTTIENGDGVIFMNFRSDRARQLTAALTQADYSHFNRQHFPQLSNFVSLTAYADNLPAKVAFPPQSLHNNLGETLEKHHMTQLRLAETEKYAHVTFFINGGRETPFVGEERILIPSLKVSTYDQAPEMCAEAITDKLIEAIEQQRFDLIIVNFANADMVGHTGNLKATIQAIETLDRCIGRIISALKQHQGEAIITADHGNAELMYDEAHQQPHTAHTLALAPFVYIGRPATIQRPSGSLSDIAPTILSLLALNIPPEMTGRSLLKL